MFMHGRSRMIIWYRPSHPHNAGTEHVGFSPTRQIVEWGVMICPACERMPTFWPAVLLLPRVRLFLFLLSDNTPYMPFRYTVVNPTSFY